jgi:dTDP-4-dehydrorhamnose 3,5-epimerase
VTEDAERNTRETSKKTRRRKRLIHRVDQRRLKDVLGEDRPVQSNFSTSYPQMIRAWHRHARGQNDYFIVLHGAAKICAYDDKTQELDEIVSTGQNLQLVRVPGQYWHGYQVIGDETVFLIYFTTVLYDYQNPDEERRPWNDEKILPLSVNGKKDDPRAGKPWNWNYPPFR